MPGVGTGSPSWRTDPLLGGESGGLLKQIGLDGRQPPPNPKPRRECGVSLSISPSCLLFRFRVEQQYKRGNPPESLRSCFWSGWSAGSRFRGSGEDPTHPPTHPPPPQFLPTESFGRLSKMRPLWEKLQSLQCHFTWNFEVKDKVDEEHIQTNLALHIKHTMYPNRGVYLTMKAYLHHLQGQYKEALGALGEAEKALERDHPTDFSRQVLVTYGNYAWVYYHLANYAVVDRYLGQIRTICRSLGSPEPYSVLIPEVQAQKGWSLLAGGYRNGEEARRCFLAALEGQASNEEFQAGLAFSVYACWSHSWREDLREEAQTLLEQVLACEPQNAQVEVCLATVLPEEELRRANSLVEAAVQQSSNPEVLRLAAKFSKKQSLTRAIAILKQAIDLDRGYHLLYYDLGVFYLEMLSRFRPENREDLVAEAADCFQRSLEACPGSIYSRLKTAKVYGEMSCPAYEEEIYLNLMEELPAMSKRCQQAIYLHWGDFLLQKKGLEQEALEMYMAGLRVPGDHPLEQKHLLARLKDLARRFRRNSEQDRADEVFRFLNARKSCAPRDERQRVDARR